MEKIIERLQRMPILLLSNGWVTVDEIKEAKHNIIVNEALLSDLTDSKMTNVMRLHTTHEIWEKLET